MLAHILYNLRSNVPPCVVSKPATNLLPAEEKECTFALWDAFPESLNITTPQFVQPLPSSGRQWCLGLYCPRFLAYHLQRDMTHTKKRLKYVSTNMLDEKRCGNRRKADREEGGVKKKNKVQHLYGNIRSPSGRNSYLLHKIFKKNPCSSSGWESRDGRGPRPGRGFDVYGW